MRAKGFVNSGFKLVNLRELSSTGARCSTEYGVLIFGSNWSICVSCLQLGHVVAQNMGFSYLVQIGQSA